LSSDFNDVVSLGATGKGSGAMTFWVRNDELFKERLISTTLGNPAKFFQRMLEFTSQIEILQLIELMEDFEQVDVKI
jgi:hypothetical protein